MAIHMICKRFGSLSLEKFPNLLKPHNHHLAFTFSSRPQPQRRTIGVSEYLLHKHHFSPQTASKASSILKRLKNPENSDLVLSFFKESGFSKSDIESVIQQVPQVLLANLNSSIKPKFKLFEDSGFSLSDSVKIIVSYPLILSGSEDNRLAPSILAIKNALGSDLDVPRLLKRFETYLGRDLETTLIPNIEFLKSVGASSSQMTTFIYRCPRFMSIDAERMKEFANCVDKMGFDRNSKMFIHAIRVYSSLSPKCWEHKLKIFRNLGFSDDDIMSMFRSAPNVLSLPESKIIEGTEFLLSTRKVDISCIANNPELLLCNIEERLKPRFQVLQILEKKSLLPNLPSISSVCAYTDDKFQKIFVLPFSNEVGVLKKAFQKK